jgi:hypothetical protein
MAGEPTPQDPKKEDESRRHARESERLESLRDRLYARGGESEPNFTRHDLGEAAHMTPNVAAHPPHSSAEPVITAHTPSIPMARSTPRRTFRTTIFVIGILFFIGALGVSSFFLFMGGNAISGSNIAIDISGPIAVGGGEIMNLQVAVANQNTLPIESATMIITYPRGAQSAVEPGKELFTERLQLNKIEPNEVVNVPVRVLMFGEENDTKKISIAVEYRVQGSNATFYKEALPFEFRINTSPIVINVNSVKSIPSGQETAIEVVIQSNSPEAMTDLLLKADYPQGFEFSESDPETVSGEDTWRIATLKPSEEKKIVIKGVMTGGENDMNEFDFVVGVANERDTLSIASPLATREAEIRIERPFLDVEITVNSKTGDPVVVDAGSSVGVRVDFRNALDTTVYDGVIQVKLGGNALNELSVDSEDGYYDSTTNVISWDSVNVGELRELTPGEDYGVTFSIDPKKDIKQNPEIKLSVTIQGNRVGEDRVPEQVVGTIEQLIKIASVTKLSSSALYSEGPFTNSGPTPPVAERTTEYTFLLAVKNGTNPVTDAEVTAVMPPYVTWLDRTSPDGDAVYNSANRTLTWDIGELKANEYKEVWVQVALKPSLSQVGTAPTLLETQRFRATDRFTGTTVRAESSALTTSLVNDPDRSLREGRVRED